MNKSLCGYKLNSYLRLSVRGLGRRISRKQLSLQVAITPATKQSRHIIRWLKRHCSRGLTAQSSGFLFGPWGKNARLLFKKEERGTALKNNFYLWWGRDRAPWIIKDRYIITYQSGYNYGSFGCYKIAGYMDNYKHNNGLIESLQNKVVAVAPEYKTIISAHLP